MYYISHANTHENTRERDTVKKKQERQTFKFKDTRSKMMSSSVRQEADSGEQDFSAFMAIENYEEGCWNLGPSPTKLVWSAITIWDRIKKMKVKLN